MVIQVSTTAKSIILLIRSLIMFPLQIISGILFRMARARRSAVSSDYYHTYAVKDADESGEYYCCIETVSGSYVIRMFTEKAKVAITKKPISVKAADSGKVYDAQPLAVNEIELTDGSSLADNHIISAVMTEESTLTNVGTKANEIERITILDSENRDVTANYEITKQSGTLSVTPRALIVAAENVRIAAGSALNENHIV